MSFKSKKGYFMGIVIWGLVVLPLIFMAVLFVYAGMTKVPSSGS